ncbi:ABC transporter substrate-binding protein [Mesobacillus sp. AQ2]|uniref:ABC transporter substrate-binding protein n=1 Tax=unclassified Mesobacillus TaxID=2675270 RepID=UPI00203BECBE|nr:MULTISPECIES: ABC transporter substrate-binding protein [unclassified Mesobacillus]MCM3124251.1 ABC transporter substrate-binding protein [Mesobacillus sp. MER 33]MCM3235039.1 ABC transporter substrate-binding protein [Mesobacillus sp. MER 48]WHX41332.1 ABC transporter substrate-binding protein [Mesobacillus sp. AQ2]
MDRHLLLLWNQVKSGAVKVEELAEVLVLSTKQTRRKLQQWQEEGWLTFQSGRGRGNTSSLEWNRQVEQEYEDLFFRSLEKEPIESVSKLLLLDWSVETKQRLMTAFQAKLGFNQEGQDSLIIPRFYPFVTFHPLKLADAHSANIIANLYNRLVTLNADDSVDPELAHSWEYTDNQLVLYLRKDVAFHDGSILKAEDAVGCLQQMKQDENFADLWEPITAITTPSPLVVKLEFPGGCSYVLQLLGLLTASIFKEVNGKLLGTGGFYLAEESAEKTALSAFKQYYGYRPLLDRVEFIQVPKEFQVVYHAGHESKQVDTFKVESDSGFGIVVMNPYRSSDMARKEVRDYIHMVIDRHRHELPEVDGRITGNNEGCLIGLSRPYTMPEFTKPSLSAPLKMIYVNYTTNTSLWLKEKLEEAGLDVEMEEVSFRDALYDPKVKMGADLFIHGEIFEMNQSFSYFFFLKNSFSPLHCLIEKSEYLQQVVEDYTTTPFEQWNSLHLQIEQYMKVESLCVPLYYTKRQIPFSINLMNVEIRHFGYVDLTKLWTKNA